jgi:ribonuclease Z
LTWLVQARLVNDPFSDPALFIDFRFGRRALLFDLGDLTALSARELSRVSHAFVSHTHMDHFAGFDRLLRLCLHRLAPLHLTGPPGFLDQVEHKLRAYTWNLLDGESLDFRLTAAEFDGTRVARLGEFRAQEAFRLRPSPRRRCLPQRCSTKRSFAWKAPRSITARPPSPLLFRKSCGSTSGGRGSISSGFRSAPG